MKKYRPLLLILLATLIMSCSLGMNDTSAWLRNKGFSGPATATVNADGKISTEDFEQIAVKFDAEGRFELYKMEAKGELKHTYTASTCNIQGVVISNGSEFTLKIDIRQLPKRRIEYRETMTLVDNPNYVRTVEAVLNEHM